MYRYTLLGKLRFAESPKDSDFLYKQKPELMTSFDDLHQKASSLIDERYNPLRPIGFLSETDLHVIAKANVERLYDKISKYVDIDHYYQINFTCDYYLKRTLTRANSVYDYIDDALKYWYDELNITRKNDRNYAVSFNKPSFNSPFPKLIQITKDSEKDYHYVRVPALCSKFSLYILENLINTPWYTSDKRLYDRYLLNNFLDIKRCQFEDSDYYIFEQLTNINSVMVFSSFLCNILTKEESELLKTNNMSNAYSRELDMLIQACAQSPLVFSKSIILKILLDDAKNTFDTQRELAYLLRYVYNQFTEINSLLTNPAKGIVGAIDKFVRYYIKAEDSIDKDALYFKKQEYIMKFKNAPKRKYILSKSRFNPWKITRQILPDKNYVENWAYNMVIFKEIQDLNLDTFISLKRYFKDDKIHF